MVRGRIVQAVEPSDEEDAGRVNPAVQGVQALTRGLALLDIVADSKRPLRFSEIAEAAGLAKGTVHRMLAALVEAGFLQLDEPRPRPIAWACGCSRWRIGSGTSSTCAARLSRNCERLRDLTGEAGPARHPAMATKCSTSTSARRCRPMRLANGVGGRAAAHATSAGKAILAHLEPAAARACSRRWSSSASRPTRSPTAPNWMRSSTSPWRAAMPSRPRSRRRACTRSPPRSSTIGRRPLGAICVLGPSFRLNVDKLHALGREVMEAARRMSGNAGQVAMSITIEPRPLGEVRADVRGRGADYGFPGRGADLVGQRAKLYWVDILAPAIHVGDPATGRHRDRAHARTGRARSCHGAAAASSPPCRAGSRASTLRRARSSLIAAPEADRPGNRFNDGKCDRRGRFWAGTLAIDTTPGQAALYRLDPDGRVHRDGERLPRLERTRLEPGRHARSTSPTAAQAASTSTTSTSRAARSRTGGSSSRCPKAPARQTEWRSTPKASSGRAHWDGWCITRYDPQGRVDRVINLPVPRPTSCAFGGPDLHDPLRHQRAHPPLRAATRRSAAVGQRLRHRDRA